MLRKSFGPPTTTKALSSPNTWSTSWIPVETSLGAFQSASAQLTNSEVLAYSTVYRCTDIISASVAKMPLVMEEFSEDNVWRQIHSFSYAPLLRRPARHYNYTTWMRLVVNHLMIAGNAYALKLYDGAGRVRALPLLNPRRVEVRESDDGEVFYLLQGNKLAGIPEGQHLIPARHIVHFRHNPLNHPLQGCSPLVAAINGAEVGTAISEREKYIHQNKGYAGGVLEMPANLTEDQIAAAKTAWNASVASTASQVAVLEAGITYKPLRLTAQEAETIAALKLANEEIARAFGVPLEMLGLAQSNADPEALTRKFYEDKLHIILDDIEATLTYDLDVATNRRIRFDTSQLLRMSPKTRAEVDKLLIQSGVLAPNEGRAHWGLPPVEGGDSPMIQVQNFSLEALAKRDAKDDPFSTAAPAQPEPTEEQDDDDEEAEEEKALANIADFGVWDADNLYQTGSAVTCKGALWIAQRTTDQKPGTEDSGWRLAVKSGKQ